MNKKYIIVSIIVAALFVGGSIMVAKAVTAPAPPIKAKTLTINYFSAKMARGLIKIGASNLSQLDLTAKIVKLVNNIAKESGGGAVFMPYDDCMSGAYSGTHCHLSDGEWYSTFTDCDPEGEVECTGPNEPPGCDCAAIPAE